MPSDRASIQTLKRLISEVDLILETTPLPENRTARSRELLGAALALTDDLLATSKPGKSAAALLGAKGGAAIAKRGSDYFRKLQSQRRNKAGGRPPKPPSE
jgi:hypothetical protein